MPSSATPPPPPGFDMRPPSRSSTPKTTSFNNLAMALGTGLAECMDDSTNAETTTASIGGGADAAVGAAATTSTTTTSNVTTENTAATMNANANAVKAPGRIHTPDTYARQSRHSVNRLIMNMGSSGECVLLRFVSFRFVSFRFVSFVVVVVSFPTSLFYPGGWGGGFFRRLIEMRFC